MTVKSWNKVHTKICFDKMVLTPGFGPTNLVDSWRMRFKMEKQDISFGRRVKLCVRILGVAWKVRPVGIVGYFIGAFIEIASMVISIYSTAKLASLLAVFVG